MPDCILGIDLGTSNSVVAVVKEDGVEVLPNDIGGRTTPSVVHLGPQERQVGEAALRMAVSDPSNTVRSVKSVLGRTYQALRESEKPSSSVVKIAPAGDWGGTVICLSDPGDQAQAYKYTPEEISAFLLLEMKKSAELHLERQVTEAVIAVPAYFNAAQRSSVRNAAFLAGLRVVQLVNETSAAALAYAQDREGPRTAVIVDVGGGGGSVSVVRVERQGCVQVLATSGARLPGGEDFDNRMLEYLVKVVKDSCGKDVSDARDLAILLFHWQTAKHQLSRIPQTNIATFLPGVREEFQVTIKQSDFEQQCLNLFQTVVDCLRETLAAAAAAALAVSAVSDVVLVGGSTRIPRLRSLIEAEFQESDARLCKAVNPDEAVACGAALLAAGAVQLQREVTPLFSIVASGEQVVRIPAGTPLSVEFQLQPQAKGFLTVKQGVNQGDAIVVFNRIRALVPLQCSFNLSGELELRNSSNGPQPVEVTLQGCTPIGECERILKRIEEHAREEVAERERIQVKNSVEEVLRNMLNWEAQGPDMESLARDLANWVRQHVGELSEWLETNSSKSKEFFEEHLASLQDVLAQAEEQKKRLQAREDLRNLLLQHVLNEVQDDKSPEAEDLRRQMTATLNWIDLTPAATRAEIQERSRAVKQALHTLQDARDCRAAELKRLQARTKLRDSLGDLESRLNREPGYASTFMKHLHDGRRWLEHHSDATEDEFNSRTTRVTQCIEEFERFCQQERVAAEKRQVEARDALADRLRSLMSQQDDKDTSDLKCLCQSGQEWLRINATASEEMLRIYLTDLDNMVEGIEESRRVAALKSIREKLTGQIHNLQCDESDQRATEFRQFCVKKLKWLNGNSKASRKELVELDASLQKKQAAFKATRVSRSKCNVAKKETNTADPEQVSKPTVADNLKSTSAVESTQPSGTRSVDVAVSCGAGTEAKETSNAAFRVVSPPQEPVPVEAPGSWTRVSPGPGGSGQLTSSDSRGSEKYDEEEFTVKKLMECKGDGEVVPDAPVERRSSKDDIFETNKKFVGILAKKLLDRVIVSVSCPWELQVPAAVSDPPVAQSFCENQALVLQCLAEEVAVQVLKEAQAAGYMALLVDKVETPDRVLILLSARYVAETAQPVERLLLVREAADERSSQQQQYLFAPFQELCTRAGVRWRDILMGVSTEGSGLAGGAFRSFLSEAAGGGIFLELFNGALPWDKRVALACYENDFFVDFFSTVDTLRVFLSVRSRFLQLKELCPNLKDDTWLTYEGSIFFLRAEYETLINALKSLTTSDPTLKTLVYFLIDKLNGAEFFSFCMTFELLFTQVNKIFEEGSSSEINFESVTSKLNKLISTLSQVQICQAVRDMLSDDLYNQCEDRTQNIVEQSRKISIEITKRYAAAYNTHACHSISQRFEKLNSSAQTKDAELRQFRSAFPRGRFSSPSELLRVLPRAEFREKFPGLYSTAVLALTQPLQPCEQRSSDRLQRTAARLAATCPTDRLSAIAVLVQDEGRLSSAGLDRVVEDLADRCPELQAELTSL